MPCLDSIQYVAGVPFPFPCCLPTSYQVTNTRILSSSERVFVLAPPQVQEMHLATRHAAVRVLREVSTGEPAQG